MGLKNWLTRSSFKKAYQDFEKATQAPALYDRDSWLRIRGLLRRSQFWGPHIPANARLEDFEVTDYEAYRSSLDAALAGRLSPLTGEEILYWCESSGTTGPKKHFPITASFRDESMRISPANLYSLSSRFPGFPERKVLHFTSTAPKQKTSAGIDVGFMSHFNFKNLPASLKKTHAFPLELLESSELFNEFSPCYALAEDLSAIFAITPAMVLQLLRRIEERGPLILKYLSGEKKLPGRLPPLKVSKKRLELLRTPLSTGRIDCREFWPSLQFVSCWTSSLCALQIPTLKPHLGGVPLIDSSYSAAEGHLTLPLQNDQTGGVLVPGGHIVEFVEVGRPVTRANIVSATGIKEGGTYEVLLTTGMGLVRYRLYDIVLCKGFFAGSPVLEFRRKSGNMISIGQVRFDEQGLLSALAEVPTSLPERWSFGTNPEGDRLILYVSSRRELGESFDSRMEHALLNSHEEYKTEISNQLMRPFEVREVPRESTFWGQDDHAQGKPRVISPSKAL